MNTTFKTKVATSTAFISLNELVIKLFNAALISGPTDFKRVNEEALKLGYLIHPDICSDDVLLYLRTKSIDYGSTFYKKWSSIINKNRFELFIDQLRHYASTYGTNFTGEPYIPEHNAEIPPFTTLKVIVPITKEEVISRCEKMLFSGIALSQLTIQDLLSILKELGHTVDIEKVQNREAKMFLYKETSKLPIDATEMVRYLVFLATGESLLIKDGKTLAAIKAAKLNIVPFLEKFGVDKLSAVYHRFHPIFLAFKTDRKNNYWINKLSKVADKNHIPMKMGFFESLLGQEKPIAEIAKRLPEISNFKKILLLQTINIRLKELKVRVYLVRNQKLFIQDGGKPMKVKKEKAPKSRRWSRRRAEEVPKKPFKPVNKKYLESVYKVVYLSLVESLKVKACSISLPKGINLALPTSEKSFSGNYPFGTSVDISKNDAVVGINWKGADGAQDLDFSLIDISGTKYGWNAAYTNSDNSLVFSGDMTSAEPEATELFYAAKGFKPCIAKVNLFRGNEKSKFNFFIAKEKVKFANSSRSEKPYMIDPNNIIASFDSEMDQKEKALGVITEDTFILTQFKSGKGAVSGKSVTNLYTDYAIETLDCYLSLNDVLVDAGFTIVEKDKEPQIDLSVIAKDSLIALLN